jgi:triacylglycerol lipase
MSDPNLRAPIVLVHGILGFDEWELAGQDIVDYFRGVREFLSDAGYTVPQPPKLNTAGSVEERANDLQEYLTTSALANEAVHLIAHSMGGLDARRMISRNRGGIAERIRTLTTIGTPHRGTPVANVGTAKFRVVLEAMAVVHVDVKGFSNLTTTWAEQFNQDNGDAGNVGYFSIAGEFQAKGLFPPFGDLLKPSYDLITDNGGGANDGLVPVESAKHGNFLGTWPADHFRLINWATNIVTPIEELADPTILNSYLELVQSLPE